MNWEQIAAQVTIMGAGVGAVTYLVRNVMHSYTATQKDHGRRLNDLDERSAKGDEIHREHDKDIARIDESVKDAHKRLDRAGG